MPRSQAAGGAVGIWWGWGELELGWKVWGRPVAFGQWRREGGGLPSNRNTVHVLCTVITLLLLVLILPTAAAWWQSASPARPGGTVN